MSLGKQSDEHDPVKAVHRIENFNWTMAKLHMCNESSLDGNQMEETKKLQLIHYNKFRSEAVHNEETGAYIYQGRLLKAFEVSEGTVRKVYQHTSSLSDAVMERFGNIANCPFFRNIVQVLDCLKWQKRKGELLHFGDSGINELVEHFKPLLEKNDCNIESIPGEWDILKNRLLSSLELNQKYLDVWSGVFATEEISKECSNILHIIELLLITPYANAKLERMFSTLDCVKTDWRNRMGRDRLDASL